mmetsp:Transcript_27510/g.77797  ORF Transcript_27510/g.77797 Transcript_27510/m.77797 type:complete len:340 (-) Transcript_27510:981-2000(-)
MDAKGCQATAQGSSFKVSLQLVGGGGEPGGAVHLQGNMLLRDGTGVVVFEEHRIPLIHNRRGKGEVELVGSLVVGQGLVLLGLAVELVVGNQVLLELTAHVDSPEGCAEDLLLIQGLIEDSHLVNHALEELLGEEGVIQVHTQGEGGISSRSSRARGSGECGNLVAIQVQGAAVVLVYGKGDLVPLVNSKHDGVVVLILHDDILDVVIVVQEHALPLLNAYPLKDGAIHFPTVLAAKGGHGLLPQLLSWLDPSRERVLTQLRGIWIHQAAESLCPSIAHDGVVLRLPPVATRNGNRQPLVFAWTGVTEDLVLGGDGAGLLAVAIAADDAGGEALGLLRV